MNQCYCDRSSGMCEYGHRHGGVDSMSVAMQYVPWQHWSRIYKSGRRITMWNDLSRVE